MIIPPKQFTQIFSLNFLRRFVTSGGVAIFFLVSAACSTMQKPFLYRAEKSDRQIDLFGTIHAGVPGWELPEVVTSSLKNSTRAYFEANLLEESKPQVNQLFIEDGKPTLNQRMTPAEYAELQKALPKLPSEQLKQLRPFFVQALINENEKKNLSQHDVQILDYKNGLDMTLLREAAKVKIPIETLDSENGLPCLDEVDGIALKELRKMLGGGKLQSDLVEMRELSRSYLAGDEKAIAAMLDAEATECVLKDRNSRWAALLEKNVHAGEHVFVGVGIGHLVSTKSGPSLVDLLQRQGYLVKRVTK